MIRVEKSGYKLTGYEIIMDCSWMPSDFKAIADYLERFVVPD
jgi:hypothetical protein